MRNEENLKEKTKEAKEAKERRDTEKLLVNFEFTLSDHHYTIHIMSLFVHDDEENDKSTIPLNFSEPDIVPVYPEKAINCILPLKYQQEIVEDTLTKDGLLIMGCGLGWDIITANLLYALSTPFVDSRTKKKKRGLIFVLNAQDDELIRLQEEMNDLNWEDESQHERLVIINGDSQPLRRKKLYAEGGVIAISSRVLVVDLLSLIVSANDITGLFVFHAERIKETSNDAFIINLYRDNNNWGFIKAFSDDPESFSGFTPLATKLKLLRLSNVFLWPRFHVTISQSFNIKNKKDILRKLVTEISVKLTHNMNKIQSAILTCIQSCLGELKRHNPTLATEYWDIENVHDRDFVGRIRGSMNSSWHRVSVTSKNIVSDLSTLTNMLVGLINLDSIGFYQNVQRIVSESQKVQAGSKYRSQSPWLNLDEAVTVISCAKERAFGKRDGNYMFEELPKWNELGKLVHNILQEKRTSNLKNQGPILVVCSSKWVARDLTRLLETMQEEKIGDKRVFSCRRFMKDQLREYAHWRKEINPVVRRIWEEMEAEEQKEDESDIVITKTFTRNGQPVSKRRRTRGGSVAARVNQLRAPENFEAVDIDQEMLLELNEDEPIDQESDSLEFEKTQEENQEVLDLINETEQFQHDFDFVHIDKEEQIIVQAYNDKFNASILQELHPSHIIMYEQNLPFIRRVEVYQAINYENPAHAYFMYYGDSVEEQKYLLRVKREKEAFTKLIKEKATLGKHFETKDDNAKFQINRNNIVNTRIAGSSKFKTETDESNVIVDAREFGSSTPNLLYRIGINVIPCMLTIGDYILSPKMCVERKSISDLVQSFSSGRLFQQCKQMFRHYELPVLLIEFDGTQSFSLQPFSAVKYVRSTRDEPVESEIELNEQSNIQSKILLLLYAFPKLKIIWSSSPYETAQIFLELKANQEEPDVGTALDKGANRTIETGDGNPPMYNDDAIDFIQNIPGINAVNYHILIQQVKNIEELVSLSKDKFISILGDENGKKAYNFLNRKIK